MKENQCSMVLQHLKKYGSITHLEALSNYGVARLAARISDLRHKGVNIVSETVVSKSLSGRGKHYSRYRLVEVQE